MGSKVDEARDNITAATDNLKATKAGIDALQRSVATVGTEAKATIEKSTALLARVMACNQYRDNLVKKGMLQKEYSETWAVPCFSRLPCIFTQRRTQIRDEIATLEAKNAALSKDDATYFRNHCMP